MSNIDFDLLKIFYEVAKEENITRASKNLYISQPAVSQSIKKLEDEKLEDLVKEGNVLVDFSASWCGPCQMLEPVLEELASDRSNIKIISVDVDEHEELSRKYGWIEYVSLNTQIRVFFSFILVL